MTPGAIRLGLPWRMPHYRPLNGSHPLMESFLHGNAAVWATDLDRDVPASQAQRAAVLLQLTRQARRLPHESTGKLIEWLDVDAQFSIEAQASRHDALFLHTTPLHAGTQPWVFHFESMASLFMPFLFTGNTTGVDLASQGYFKLVHEALESPACRHIFSHMRGSLETLCRVFDSPLIASKCRHVPLGIRCHESGVATSKFDRPGPLRILFTNSLHQDPRSFYLRGGHHLLAAFARLRETKPDIELTVLSSVPTDLQQRFAKAQLTGVNWISERIDDATLEQLLLEHHLFALPAAGLHSYSLLRALAHGCVPIVSDAVGYDEFTGGIEDSVLTLRGVRALVYRAEPGGWCSEDYAPFVAQSNDFARQIHDQVLEHSELPQLRALAQRNLGHCLRNFNVEQSQSAFNGLLRQL